MIKELSFLKIMNHMQVTKGYFIVKAKEGENCLLK